MISQSSITPVNTRVTQLKNNLASDVFFRDDKDPSRERDDSVHVCSH